MFCRRFSETFLVIEFKHRQCDGGQIDPIRPTDIINHSNPAQELEQGLFTLTAIHPIRPELYDHEGAFVFRKKHLRGPFQNLTFVSLRIDPDQCFVIDGKLMGGKKRSTVEVLIDLVIRVFSSFSGIPAGDLLRIRWSPKFSRERSSHASPS